jgi:hypothetical protein
MRRCFAGTDITCDMCRCANIIFQRLNTVEARYVSIGYCRPHLFLMQVSVIVVTITTEFRSELCFRCTWLKRVAFLLSVV